MERRTFTVSGMACSGCEETVANALRTLPSVRRVEADHESDAVEVVAGDDVTDADLEAALRDAGYEVQQ